MTVGLHRGTKGLRALVFNLKACPSRIYYWVVGIVVLLYGHCSWQLSPFGSILFRFQYPRRKMPSIILRTSWTDIFFISSCSEKENVEQGSSVI